MCVENKPSFDASLFDNVGPFIEGLAWVGKDGQEWHIRFDGTAAYEDRFDFVGSFSEGLAWVRKDDQRWQIKPDGSRAD